MCDYMIYLESDDYKKDRQIAELKAVLKGVLDAGLFTITPRPRETICCHCLAPVPYHKDDCVIAKAWRLVNG